MELLFTKRNFISNTDNEHGEESPNITLKTILKSIRSKGLREQPCLKADRIMNKEEIEKWEVKMDEQREVGEDKHMEQEIWDLEQEQEYLSTDW